MQYRSRTGLVIIDVQTGFRAACDSDLHRNIVKQIVLAKRRRAPIFVVEYKDRGSTFEPIMRAIGTYGCVRCVKASNSGWRSLLGAIRRHGIAVDSLRVCGIELGCCVHATVIDSLKSRTGIAVTLLWDCCRDLPEVAKTQDMFVKDSARYVTAEQARKLVVV